MTKIGIVYNPFAGKNKKDSEKRKHNLEQILGDRGLLRETRSIQDVDNALHEFHEEGVDILAISGGDGTNHFVLSRLCNDGQKPNLPLLFPLRGGTMNLLETSLGLKGNPEKRLQRLVKAMDKGQLPVISHTVLRVNNKFGYIFGNGLIANFMQEYYKGGNVGPKKAVQVLIKACMASITKDPELKKLFAPIDAYVEIEKETLPETSFMALMAATEKECGLGFQPFYKARQELGKLHFLAVNMSPMKLLLNLPQFRRGKPARSSEGMYDVLTDKVVINTFRPYYYTLDGEMLNSVTRIELSPGPIVKIIAL